MVGKEHWGFPSCGTLPCIRTSQTAAPGMFAESKTDINSGIFHLNTFLLSAHISSTVCNVDGMGSCIFWHLRNEPKCFSALHVIPLFHSQPSPPLLLGGNPNWFAAYLFPDVLSIRISLWSKIILSAGGWADAKIGGLLLLSCLEQLREDLAMAWEKHRGTFGTGTGLI